MPKSLTIFINRLKNNYNIFKNILFIRKIKPNILIKGGDYKKSEIVGGDFVIKNKGILKIIPFVKGCSTSNIIKKINKLSG